MYWISMRLRELNTIETIVYLSKNTQGIIVFRLLSMNEYFPQNLKLFQ